MSQTRDVLIHLSVETAKKKRKCHHSRGKHDIASGEQFLSVRESNGLSSKNYCKACAKPMLDSGKAKLESITTLLS